MDTSRVFDEYSGRYEGWYRVHRNIGVSENLCIRRMIPGGRILDVGVGTGVLTVGLRGLIVGLDPAEKPLQYASERGVLPVNAYGEEMPFRDSVFDYVLMSVTLCFLPDPMPVLMEAYRVLRRGGWIVTCIVPRDSPWGDRYLFLKHSGRSVFYRYARFYTVEETLLMLSAAGFSPVDACSTLQSSPLQPGYIEMPSPGLIREAGFICVRAAKN